MQTKTYDLFEEAAQVGAAKLTEILRDGAADEKSMTKAARATAAMSSFAKLYQANSAREGTVVTMITHAAADTDEFRRLVAAALPGSAVTKALQEGGSNGAKHSVARQSKAQRERSQV